MGQYLEHLLQKSFLQGSSDLHLRAGQKPLLRIDGSLRKTDLQAPTAPELDQILLEILSSDQKKSLETERSCDLSYVSGGVRFRVNVFYSAGSLAGVFRRISEDPPTLAEIQAPATMLQLARSPRGLVIVTGPTGSGKTTTLAAVIDLLNSERSDHILTIEDPVEYIHKSKRCLVSQREIGRDARDFASALRDALREDPDVVLVGEMRDYETISIALTAAETGHLVFGTLHTSSAPGSIDRIIDSFPEGEQQQARIILANSLSGIVSQALVPKQSGEGRVSAHEILVATNPVRALIRKQDTAQLRTVLQTNIREGMQTLDRALVDLVIRGEVSEDQARRRSQNFDEFDQLLRSAERGEFEAIERISEEQIVQSMEQKQAQ